MLVIAPPPDIPAMLWAAVPDVAAVIVIPGMAFVIEADELVLDWRMENQPSKASVATIEAPMSAVRLFISRDSFIAVVEQGSSKSP